MPLTGRKLALIGSGNMGRALLAGILGSGLLPAESVIATGRRLEKLEELKAETGVRIDTDNRRAAEEADIILLGIKPQGFDAVAAEIRDVLVPGDVAISILAGLTTDRLQDALGKNPSVVRSMPNIPSMVEAGATAITGGEGVGEKELTIAEAIFEAVGEVVRVTESQMDAVTGLSGSGPAYIYMIIEALTDGGVKMGLPRDVAIRLAAQTVAGSARLVQKTGLHPAILRDQVTTPGGTAIAAIHDLESHGLRPMLISAVVTATERSRALNADASAKND